MCDNRNSVGAALSRENCVDTNVLQDWQSLIRYNRFNPPAYYESWIQLASAILVIMRLCAHFQQKIRHGVFGNSMFFLVGC